MLVVGSGLILRSFWNLSAVNPGFQPDHVLTFRITTEFGDQQARQALFSQVLDRIRALPGVESAGAVLLRALGGAVGWDTEYSSDAQTQADVKANPTGNFEAISPGYFRALRIPLLAGRDFEPARYRVLRRRSDRESVRSPTALARRRRHGSSVAVGRRRAESALADCNLESPATCAIASGKRSCWTFTIPYMQRAQHRSDFVVRTFGDPLQLRNRSASSGV